MAEQHGGNVEGRGALFHLRGKTGENFPPNGTVQIFNKQSETG